MTWIVEPFSHVSPLAFGLSRSDVTRIIGAPSHQRQINADDIRDHYEKGKLPCKIILEYNGKGLESATLPWQDSDVVVCGKEVFKMRSNEALRHLESINGGRFDLFIDQYYVFRQIGVVASDLEIEDVANKWLAVSSRSAFDRTLSDLEAM